MRRWIILLIATLLGVIFVAGAYIPPDYESVSLPLADSYTAPDYQDVELTLGEGGIVDPCACPSPASNWIIDIAENCNITENCYIDGFNVSFENGTTGDMINISAMIVADDFIMDDATSGTIIHTHSNAYLNQS